MKHWYSGTGSTVTEKTPTCALINPENQTLEAFGYDAENRYTTLFEENKHRNYFYYRRFKMDLYGKVTDLRKNDVHRRRKRGAGGVGQAPQ